MGYLSLDDLDGMAEGQLVGVAGGFQGGFVHQAADREVGQHQAVEFLDDELGCLGAQHDAAAAQIGLELADGDFDFPALVIQSGQVLGRCCGGIDDGCDQAIDWLGPFDALQAIVDDPDQAAVSIVPAVFLGRVELAQV